VRIAIDAMGGDHAPGKIVKGALDAAAEWPDTRLLLVGDRERLEPLLAGKAPGNVEVVHASEVIGPDDEPVRAVRRKKEASMVVAGRLVKEGGADAMISAGNTGALMTTGLLVVGRIEGIERPALAQMLPTLDGKGVLVLDLGANMDATPEQLVQYAIMGSVYRKGLHGMERPRVGLLNVGTEPGKGNELTKAAFGLLEGAPVHFVGNVEARDLLDGVCDVLVCDGFAGNIMLKSLEGAAGSIFSMLKDAFKRNWRTKLAAAIMLPGLRGLKKMMDYKEYGGAPLFGLNGVVIKGHGSSDALALKNAVREARIAVGGGLIGRIAAEISGK